MALRLNKKIYVFIKIKLIILYLLSLIFFSSACWDMRDIDQRANIISIGIDLPEKDNNNSSINKYRMSVEIPILQAIVGPEGDGGGNEDSKPAWVISSTGNSLAEINSIYEKRLWRQPFYGHAKVLIIGEELAREGIKDVIDYFRRHGEISLRIKLIIANGEAKEVIEVNPIVEDLLGIYLDNILEYVARTGRIQTKNLGEELRELSPGGRLSPEGNTLLPRVRVAENEITVGGSAIIKNWQLVGWLGELETIASSFLQNRIRGGTLVVGDSSLPSGEISFLISESKTRIKAKQEKEDVIFQVYIHTEGDIVEQFGGEKIEKVEFIESIQIMLEEHINNIINDVFTKLRDEYKVDVIGCNDILRKQIPKLWEEIEEAWEQKYFPKVELQVESNVKIRRIGVIW